MGFEIVISIYKIPQILHLFKELQILNFKLRSMQ